MGDHRRVTEGFGQRAKRGGRIGICQKYGVFPKAPQQSAHVGDKPFLQNRHLPSRILICIIELQTSTADVETC
jgi:hypothetical protein